MNRTAALVFIICCYSCAESVVYRGPVDADIEPEERDAGTDGETGINCDVSDEWVMIQAGTFMMGSPVEEDLRDINEVQHEVTLTHDFYIRSTEVTQADFQRLMNYNPASFSGCPRCPVESINWYEAAIYCNELSDECGLPNCYTNFVRNSDGEWIECELNEAFATPYDCPGFRLPTDAEWEYAARAGTTTATYNGEVSREENSCDRPNPVLDPIAWYCSNSGDEVHEVGLLLPNRWGLYDMLGNVSEWCSDSYIPFYSSEPTIDPFYDEYRRDRITRGGAWVDGPPRVRSASRWRDSSTFSNRYTGFRPVRSIP